MSGLALVTLTMTSLSPPCSLKRGDCGDETGRCAMRGRRCRPPSRSQTSRPQPCRRWTGLRRWQNRTGRGRWEGETLGRRASAIGNGGQRDTPVPPASAPRARYLVRRRRPKPLEKGLNLRLAGPGRHVFFFPAPTAAGNRWPRGPIRARGVSLRRVASGVSSECAADAAAMTLEAK